MKVSSSSGDVSHERAERVRERAERQALAAHLDAAAREDSRARLARASRRLLDKPRLAHAGLAAEDHDRGIPRDGRVEGSHQRCQLGVSADEDRADESGSHGLHVLSPKSGRLRRAGSDLPIGRLSPRCVSGPGPGAAVAG
jgi:hypothetical protein